MGPKNDGSPTTERLDIYDLRTGKHFAAKQNPLDRRDLAPFVEWYRSDRGPQSDGEAGERFRSFGYAELAARGLNMDITWLRDEVAEEILSPRLLLRHWAEEKSNVIT